MDNETVEVTVAKGHTIHTHAAADDAAAKHHGPGAKVEVPAKDVKRLVARGVIVDPNPPEEEPEQEPAAAGPSITSKTGGPKVSRRGGSSR